MIFPDFPVCIHPVLFTHTNVKYPNALYHFYLWLLWTRRLTDWPPDVPGRSGIPEHRQGSVVPGCSGIPELSGITELSLSKITFPIESGNIHCRQDYNLPICVWQYFNFTWFLNDPFSICLFDHFFRNFHLPTFFAPPHQLLCRWGFWSIACLLRACKCHFLS